MNKRNMIPFLVMVAVLCFSVSIAIADTHVVWDGNFGTVDIDVYSDDDRYSGLFTTGIYINGVFDLDDYENNPYGYGVDTVVAYTHALVADGIIDFTNIRLDSGSSYGADGQLSTSIVNVLGGFGTLDFRTTTNYANLVSSNYNFQSNMQFTANAQEFVIFHKLASNPYEFALLDLQGSGSASVDYMADGYTGASGYYFGTGDGCYENADLTATGSGLLRIEAWADNNLWAHDGSWAQGGGSYIGTWSYSGSLVVDDYAIGGN